MGKEERQKATKGKPYYSTSSEEKALVAIANGTSILAASKAFHVPYSTLHSRVKGTYSVGVKRGPASILNVNEEKELVEWAIRMNKIGFPVTKDHLLDSVQYIVKKTQKVTPFTNGRPSRHWYEAFMKRNPELSVKTCQNLTKARANVSETGLRRWFAEIKSTLTINPADIGPERIFNLDESAFCLSPKNDRVIVRKGEKAVYNVCISDKECYTALIGGNAAGQLVPTMIIYNYSRIAPLIAQHFPTDFVIGKSETGWMKSETFVSYIANHFYPWCVKNSIQFPIILYLDGHSSHVTKELSDFCCSHGIELVSLYPNATHLMQPMDVVLFHPLKIAYREAVRAWRLDNEGAELTRYYFASVIKNALFSLDVVKIFKKGFERCGLYPFSEEGINYDKLILSNKKTTEVTNQNQQEQLNTIEDDNTNKEENFLTVLESKIDSHTLEHFKTNYPNEWTGEIQFKELYNFWLNVSQITPAGFDSNMIVIKELIVDTIDVSCNDLITNKESIIKIIATNANTNEVCSNSETFDHCTHEICNTSAHVEEGNDFNIEEDILLHCKNDISSDTPIDLSTCSYNSISNNNFIISCHDQKCNKDLESNNNLTEVSSQALSLDTTDCNDILTNLLLTSETEQVESSTDCVENPIHNPHSVFGSENISGYLFYPSLKEKKEKKKNSKPKLPPAASGGPAPHRIPHSKCRGQELSSALLLPSNVLS